MEVIVQNPNNIIIDVDQGRAGRGISSISYEQQGDYYYLVISYTDSSTQTLGPLVITGAAVSLLGGTPGAIAYQQDTDQTTFLPLGSANQLVVAGATAPVYKTLTAGTRIDVTASETDITVSMPDPDFITFDTTPETSSAVPGTLYWDTADGNQTLSLVMAGGNVRQQIGEETFYRIKATAPITEGQVVMFTGTVGASGALTGAPATGLTAFQGEYVMGVATENIALNAWGYVTWFGLVRNINTTGGAEAWVDGDILYFNPAVPGGLTKNVPSAPNAKVIVASVVHAATNGSIFVRPTFGSAFGSTDSNVQFGTLANGDIITYDLANQYWKNVAQSTLTVGKANNLVGGTANQIPYQSAPNTTAFASTGTGVLTALGVNVGTDGAFVVKGGALGTPSSATLTNASGLPLTTGVTGVLPVTNGGTGASTAAAAIQNLLPAYTGNANKRLGLNGTADGLEWVADGGGTVTSVDASGGTTGLTFSGGPVTSSGTLTLGGTLAVGSGGTGVTTSTGSGSVVLSTSPTLTTPNLGTPSALTLTNATGLPLSTGVTGTLPTTNGGTGLTSFTANGVVYASSTSALTTGGALTFNGSTLATTGALTVSGNTTLGDASTDTVTVNGTTGLGGANPYPSNYKAWVGGANSNANTYGFASEPTISVAGVVSAFASIPTTGASAITVTDARGFYAANAVKGAGSTITNQHGVYIADQTQGTNNYGITSLVSSGTNKWNIYASGTAQNYFGGRIGIGTTVPVGVLDATGTIYSRFLNTTAPTLDNDTHAGEALYLRSGGTAGAENVQAVLAFGKADSSSQRSGAAIASIQTTADTDQIGLAFYVSSSTSSLQTMSERFRIGTSEAVFNEVSADYDFRVESDTNTHALFVQGSDGFVGIGTSTPQTFLHVDAASGQRAIFTGRSGISQTMLASYHSTGSLINISQHFSSLAGSFGYAVKQDTATQGYLSSSSLNLGRSAVEVNNGFVRILTDGAQTSTDGGAVTLTERLRIDSSGNLGIGTSSPTYRLQNSGSTNSFNTAALFERAGASPSTGAQYIGAVLKAKGTAIEMTDGFGAELAFAVEDATSGEQFIAAIDGVRSGADNSGALLFKTYNAGTSAERMRLDSSGNLGLGVTPSAWLGINAFEFGTGTANGSLYGYNNELGLSVNTYYRSGYKYVSNGLASHYRQAAGTHAWFTAPSGTAGNAISFTQAMTLDASGNLLVGTTSNSPSGKLNIAGNITPQTTNTHSLGTSSYVWSNVYATAFTEAGYGVVSQTDIGTAPNEIPLNQYLGNLAYMNSNAVVLNPVASATPVGIGDMVFQLTNDTTLVVKVKGSDGTVRSATLTLA